MTSNPFLILAAMLGGLAPLQAAVTWTASDDFYANELSTDSNPNTPWSYGHRDTVVSASITLFSGADHKTAINTIPNFEGWQIGSGFMITGTNTSASNLGTLQPGELLVHPQNNSANPTYNVIRWTAPTTGDYTLAFSWRVDSTVVNATNDGVDAHVVVNASSIFNTIVGPDSTVSDSAMVSLVAGQVIDFVVGPGASGFNEGDSTVFDATITLVPEPSSTLLLAAALPLCFLRRRSGSH